MNKKQPNPKLPKPAQKPPKAPQKSSFDVVVKFGKQALIALVGLFLLIQIKNSADGYRWVYDSLLKGNMEVIKKHPNLSVDERYQLKIGFPIAFLNHIKQHTPDSAIILIPKHTVFSETPKDPNQSLRGMADWSYSKYAYFRYLQPRKVVFEWETDSPYFEKVTHVAIINGWGYDYLSYPVHPEHRPNIAILPIHSNQ
ncbi:MAG: hypothetical protein LBH22_05125 [Bacteroidales bacterium]|jgi:hypothetical protein|nr:hypothetical protein [Bacteroidales bacterium]